MRIGNRTEYAPEVRRHRQVTPILKVFHRQRRNIPKHLPPGDMITQDKVAGTTPMVRTPRAILMDGPAEFSHRHHGDIILVTLQVLPESGHTITQIGNITGKNAVIGPLVEMR